LTAYPYLETTTTEMLAQQNQGVSNLISQMVTVVGLVSLLLGSIGIINTMQVIVRRRTVEVAVLKTMGLQAGEVTMLFLVEAFLMGILGSLAGILLGWATTFIIKGVAETVVAQSLPFRIALMPVVNGLLVGTLVTTIFGFLPTLAAGQVRPGVVLRPNDQLIPRAGRLRTVLALLVIILALSLVASLILGSFPTALAVTIGAFFAAGFLVLLLSFLIWLIGRFFPSLGSVDLKLSLRQMLAGRGRGATTLLALVVGVFSLSLITMFAESINNTLSSVLSSAGGGNVIIVLLDQTVIPEVTATLEATEGVSDYQVLQRYDGTLMSVEAPDGTVWSRDQLATRIEQNSDLNEVMATLGGDAGDMDAGEMGLSMLSELTGSDLTRALATPIQQGRAFTEADAGRTVIIATDSTAVQDAQLQVGDRLTYAFDEGGNAPQITFELIGIAQRPVVETLAGGSGIYVPQEALSAIQPSSIQVFASVDESAIAPLRRNLTSVPGATLLETAIFTRLITGLLGTFIAFPTMVALLGLIVGGVVIANSVALSTMERRREIAVMKAVGLQRERVLGMLLLENGLLGLIGGIIGVGLGVLILLALSAATGSAGGVIPYGSALLLMLLCILVALVAAVTSAWGASGEKPLNVLRYE
jgi:ABC-type antimicrobial peptide transport system permease subunit